MHPLGLAHNPIPFIGVMLPLQDPFLQITVTTVATTLTHAQQQLHIGGSSGRGGGSGSRGGGSGSRGGRSGSGGGGKGGGSGGGPSGEQPATTPAATPAEENNDYRLV